MQKHVLKNLNLNLGDCFTHVMQYVIPFFGLFFIFLLSKGKLQDFFNEYEKMYLESLLFRQNTQRFQKLNKS